MSIKDFTSEGAALLVAMVESSDHNQYNSHSSMSSSTSAASGQQEELQQSQKQRQYSFDDELDKLLEDPERPIDLIQMEDESNDDHVDIGSRAPLTAESTGTKSSHGASDEEKRKDIEHTERTADLTEMQDESNDDDINIEIGGPVTAESTGTSSSHSTSEEEKQPTPSEAKEDGIKSHVGPDTKRLIYKLLKDYEDMERLLSNEEKFQQARQTGELELRKSISALYNSSVKGSFAGNNIPTEPDFTSQVLTQLGPSRGTRDGFGDLFEPELLGGLCFSKSVPPTLVSDSFSLANRISVNNSSAPDPPEINASQTQCIDPSFPAFVGQSKTRRNDDDDDRHSDDLSSRMVSIMIDEDVQSDCKAAKDHNTGGRQYWRDIILGVNDGLVSTFLLVAGVRGGGMSSEAILLTAIAGSVAGAISMCSGEYLATKSQNEVVQGEMKTEERHIREHRRDELVEVSDLLELIGIGADDRALQKRLIRHYARDPQALLKCMIALELGFLEDEERSPLMAGVVSFFLFLIGAFPSVVPFMVPGIDPTVGFIAAGVATCNALLIVGAVKTWATKGNCLVSAAENLFIAGFGGAIAYVAGVLSYKFIEG